MNIYIGAMLSCWKTYKEKYVKKYSGVASPKYQDFSYFCFHTPFSKMVQKSFFALVIEEIRQQHTQISNPFST